MAGTLFHPFRALGYVTANVPFAATAADDERMLDMVRAFCTIQFWLRTRMALTNGSPSYYSWSLACGCRCSEA
jgi:hypothetical protein